MILLTLNLEASGQVRVYSLKAEPGAPSNVTVSLTGVSANASPGSLAPGLAASLSGVALNTQSGSLAAALSLALSGIQAGTAAGTASPGRSLPISGIASTTSAGTVTATVGGGAVTVSITGQSLTTEAGAVVPALSVSVPGVSQTTLAGSVAAARSITLSGAQTAGQAGIVGTTGGVVLLRQKGLRKTRYTPTTPPANAQELARYVQQELERLTDGLESPFTHQLLEKLSVEPQRKPQGKALIAYADGTNWNPGSGEGLYAYYAGSWKKL